MNMRLKKEVVQVHEHHLTQEERRTFIIRQLDHHIPHLSKNIELRAKKLLQEYLFRSLITTELLTIKMIMKIWM